MADVVAGDVLAMLGELDGEAVVGAGMLARHIPLDDHPRLEVETFQVSQRLRI